MSYYKLVPVEPTAEMVEAATEAFHLSSSISSIVRAALAVVPAVQGEPVAFRYRASESDRWNYVDWRRPDKFEKDNFEIQHMSVAMETAENQPAPDVAGLVEALSSLLESLCIHKPEDILGRAKGTWSVEAVEAACAALAAHRSRGGE